MRTAKHTPGPWERLTFSNHELQTDFAMIKIGERVHMVGYSDVDWANARLIAAAPELLNALRELLSAYEQPDRLICCNGHECGCMGMSVHQEAEYYANATIAKAEGES